MRERLFSVSCEMLQTDLGGLEAPSGYRVLITIAILWVSRGIPPIGRQEPQHMPSSRPGECPPGVPHGGGRVLSFLLSLCRWINLEVGEGFLERKECLVG